MDKDKIIALLNQDIESEHGAIVQYLSHAYAMGEGEMACEIEALAREEMARIIPDFSKEVQSVEVVRHHTGMPRYRVGIYPRLRRFLKSVSGIDGLHLVGDYYGHSTIETVVRSARRATDQLLSGA